MAESDAIHVGAVGDVMCGESFYEYGSGPRSHIAALGSAYLDPGLQALFRRQDVTIANIECPVSDVGYRSGSLRSHHMRAQPGVARLLREWGISVANVANNHILEHGTAAAVDTVSNLEAAGIQVVGAGDERQFRPGFQPREVSIRGVRLGLCGACLLDDKYAFDGGVARDDLPQYVRELARRVDVVVVSLHWGVEYMDAPTPDQRSYAKRLVDAGATLIVGHHPHVVQGVERLGHAVVAYSLGNCLFDQPVEAARRSAVLACTLQRGNCVQWQWNPITLCDNHTPMLLRPPEVLYPDVVPPLAEHDESAYCSMARERRELFRSCMRRRIRANWHRFPLRYRVQVLARPIVRRMGMW